MWFFRGRRSPIWAGWHVAIVPASIASAAGCSLQLLQLAAMHRRFELEPPCGPLTFCRWEFDTRTPDQLWLFSADCRLHADDWQSNPSSITVFSLNTRSGWPSWSFEMAKSSFVAFRRLIFVILTSHSINSSSPYPTFSTCWACFLSALSHYTCNGDMYKKLWRPSSSIFVSVKARVLFSCSL